MCEIRQPQSIPQLQGQVRGKAKSAHVLELELTPTATVWKGADIMEHKGRCEIGNTKDLREGEAAEKKAVEHNNQFTKHLFCSVH